MTVDAHPRPVVLALDVGSVTIAATAYRLDPAASDASPLTSVWQLDVVRLTDPQQITVTTDDAKMSTTAPGDDLDAAVLPGLDALIESLGSDTVIAVGHRIVHGGDFDEPVVIATRLRHLGVTVDHAVQHAIATARRS